MIKKNPLRLADEFISGLKKAWQSKFIREAALIFTLNLVSKTILFFGMAYAAKCLGPLNLGISARIQTLVQQFSLFFNGGFDYIAVRHISAKQESLHEKAGSVLLFRLIVSTVLAIIWVAIIQHNDELDASLKLVWLLGPISLVVASINSSFVFQAIERLPLFAFITSIGSIVTSGFYILTFHPRMPLGSDLLVSVSVALVVSVASLLLVFGRLKIASAKEIYPKLISWIMNLRGMLFYSWRYWLIAITVFIYSGFPLILISHYKGDYEAGIFRAAFMMAAALELFFGSFNSLLLPKFVKLKKDSPANLWHTQTLLLKLYLIIGIGIGALAVLIAPLLLIQFLGHDYLRSIQIFQILVIGRVIVFIGQIYALGIIALHLDREFMWASILGAVLSLSINFLVVPVYGIYGAAWAIVLSELLVHSIFYYSQRKAVLSSSVQSDQ
jgi:O-antigen/teichoic acid export membrane protein